MSDSKLDKLLANHIPFDLKSTKEKIKILENVEALDVGVLSKIREKLLLETKEFISGALELDPESFGVFCTMWRVNVSTQRFNGDIEKFKSEMTIEDHKFAQKVFKVHPSFLPAIDALFNPDHEVLVIPTNLSPDSIKSLLKEHLKAPTGFVKPNDDEDIQKYIKLYKLIRYGEEAGSYRWVAKQLKSNLKGDALESEIRNLRKTYKKLEKLVAPYKSEEELYRPDVFSTLEDLIRNQKER